MEKQRRAVGQKRVQKGKKEVVEVAMATLRTKWTHTVSEHACLRCSKGKREKEESERTLSSLPLPSASSHHSPSRLHSQSLLSSSPDRGEQPTELC